MFNTNSFPEFDLQTLHSSQSRKGNAIVIIVSSASFFTFSHNKQKIPKFIQKQGNKLQNRSTATVCNFTLLNSKKKKDRSIYTAKQT